MKEYLLVREIMKKMDGGKCGGYVSLGSVIIIMKLNFGCLIDWYGKCITKCLKDRIGA